MRTEEDYAIIKQRLQGILDSYEGAELLYQVQDFMSHLES